MLTQRAVSHSHIGKGIENLAGGILKKRIYSPKNKLLGQSLNAFSVHLPC